MIITIWLIVVTLIAVVLAVEVVRLNAKLAEVNHDIQQEIFRRKLRLFMEEGDRG